MPQIIAGNGGVNRQVKKIPVGVSGVNRNCKEIWAGVNGVNRKVFTSGVEIGTLPIGALIKDNSSLYYGRPIVWRIIDKYHSGYPAGSVTLITDKIISLKCADAREPLNGNTDRRSFGNSRYIHSNIRCWLNSSAAASGWYAAQHGQDAPPDGSRVWNSFNEYDAETGFQYCFSTNMRTALLNTVHIVGRSDVDGGGTETCVDKIFLPSCTEVGIFGDAICGVKLAGFSDNTSRQAYPTAECVNRSEYQESRFNTSAAWQYWLCDGCAGVPYASHGVGATGRWSQNLSYRGFFGVRPLCNLSSANYASETPDNDGAYILQF